MEILKQAYFFKVDIINRHSATPLLTSQCLRYTILQIRNFSKFAFHIYQLVAIGIRRHTLNTTKNSIFERTAFKFMTDPS